MHEADKIYLSKFLIDSNIDAPAPDEPHGVLNQYDMFSNADSFSELDIDDWCDME
jgi:hypothetical protein